MYRVIFSTGLFNVTKVALCSRTLEGIACHIQFLVLTPKVHASKLYITITGLHSRKRNNKKNGMQSNSRGGEKSFPSAPLHQGGNLPLQKKNPEPIISVEYRLGKICHAKSRYIWQVPPFPTSLPKLESEPLSVISTYLMGHQCWD